jgi:hypothetical protein
METRQKEAGLMHVLLQITITVGPNLLPKDV